MMRRQAMVVETETGRVEAHVTAEYPMQDDTRTALEAIVRAASKHFGDRRDAMREYPDRRKLDYSDGQERCFLARQNRSQR